jgi:hypothetical protein
MTGIAVSRLFSSWAGAAGGFDLASPPDGKPDHLESAGAVRKAADKAAFLESGDQAVDP